jgi:hypothetical protein
MPIIYGLKCQHGCFYVGRSRTRETLDRRLEHHRNSTVAWLRMHPPLEHIFEYEDECEEEDKQVLTLMRKFGVDRVRGGRFSNIELTQAQLSEIDRSIRHASDACMRCGQMGHFQSQCSALSARELHAFSDSLVLTF